MTEPQTGITLIALIITIIIMLILVGVTITILVKSDLIGATKTAAERWQNETDKEKEIGSKIVIDGVEYDSIEDYVNNRPSTGENEDTEDTEIIHTSSSNVEYEDGDKVATIPAGFTVSKISGETSIDGGLVIYDIPDGTEVNWNNPDSLKTVYNQFVWIPVEFTKTAGANYQNDPAFEAVWQRSAWENNARVATPTSSSIPTSSQWSSYTEPYSYVESGVNADYDGEGTSKTGIAAELDEMKQSVYKYGGFYIARYEAGTTSPRKEEDETTVSPLKFVQDAYPYNYVCWGDPSKTWGDPGMGMGDISEYGAVYLSRNISFQSGSTAVTSMLCSGVAWDAMLDFVKDSNHDVTNSTSWGNYCDASFDVTRATAQYYEEDYEDSTVDTFKQVGSGYTKEDYYTSGIDVLLTTGASERNKAKNIYDIAGNCCEWTTEANNSINRVLRGFVYDGDGSDYPASDRHNNYPYISAYVYSVRPTLYVNL